MWTIPPGSCHHAFSALVCWYCTETTSQCKSISLQLLLSAILLQQWEKWLIKFCTIVGPILEMPSQSYDSLGTQRFGDFCFVFCFSFLFFSKSHQSHVTPSLVKEPTDAMIFVVHKTPEAVHSLWAICGPAVNPGHKSAVKPRSWALAIEHDRSS